MRLHFDNVDLRSTSGPNSFAYRLGTYLKNQGHTIVIGDGHDCDISLVFIEPSGCRLAPKVVQRLDGIWFSPDEFKTKNINIETLYRSADHVVWQSLFDKEMVNRWWGMPKNGSVIRNGIARDYKKNSQLAEKLNDLRQQYEKVFVCSANWHPQKRLNTNIDFFVHIKQFYKSACLLVLGHNPLSKKTPDVYIIGSQNHDVCMQIFQNSDWMLHLAWLDHCPNTVVEALSCGTPVVCSSDGGTKELVQNFGIILQEKKKYDFELSYYDHPPDLDVTQWKGPLPERASLGQAPDLSIEDSAKKYLEIFQQLTSTA